MKKGSAMTVRQYFVVATERPYIPIVGEDITYTLELDTSQMRYDTAPSAPSMPHVELTVRITYVEPSWGPNTLRVEGFTRNPHTNEAHRVIGHHKARPAEGEHRIGVLQVTEDD